MTLFLQTAGWVLIHFLWQGIAISAAASTLLTVTRQRSARIRYAIACASLVAMVAAPVLTARLVWTTEQYSTAGWAGSATAPIAAVEGRTPSAGGAQHPTPGHRSGTVRWEAPANQIDATGLVRTLAARIGLARLEPYISAVAIAWLCGVLLLLARMGGGWWHVRRLHHTALATSSSRWQSSCRRLAYRLGLPAAAHVIESSLVDVPTVVGWLRPAILLPIAALASLTPAQVEAILAHELAHIRRHDYAVNLLQTIAETLLFYHPAVWWLSQQVRIEREHCCDDIAIAICGDPVGYAQALAELETWRTSTTTMAMAATGGALVGRVRRILRLPLGDEPRSPSWAVTLALTFVFTAGAGSVQYFPWSRSQGDSRAAAIVSGSGVAGQTSGVARGLKDGAPRRRAATAASPRAGEIDRQRSTIQAAPPNRPTLLTEWAAEDFVPPPPPAP
ncbi:MAG: M56 family metallopeptidase, partial [Vicinamibacterales bacterium]